MKSKRKQWSPLAKSADSGNPAGKKISSTPPTDPKDVESTGAMSKAADSLESAETPPAKPFPVVGIGASAGGLEAFTAFLKALSPTTGMAFVLIQHMDPRHESMLHVLLAKDTTMPVKQVEDGMSLEPNHVYVIRPDAEMTIHGGVLKLVARPTGATRYTPIDTFFCALAEDQKDKAIGIILSGIGSDGTKGLQAIKAEGGVTFAQDEASSKYPGMPMHAEGAGCVDLVLPPDKLATELVRIVRHPYLQIAPQAIAPSGLPSEDSNTLQRILRQVRLVTGVDFANYKQTTIRRRIGRRMLVRRCETLPKYAKYLLEHPDEVKALFEDVLIHVTSFFRDAEMYEVLKTTIFPRIIATLGQSDAIRIWVPGCSSGEEVYSLAMVLQECLGEQASGTRIQMFGTDVSERDIQKARAAVYAESSLSDVSPQRVRRFFAKVEGGYQVSKILRDLCVFARHDVTKDPPFSHMDLVSCRNVLIYLASPLQKKVLNYLHYALKPTGYLVLGKSESVSAAAELYSVLDRKASIYSKVEAPMHTPTEFQFALDKEFIAGKPVLTVPSFDVRKEAERIILERYAPAGFVLDENLQVINFQGDASPFLKPKQGEASLNLLNLVRAPLMLEIRMAIQDSKKSGAALVRREGIRFKNNGTTSVTDLEVVPIKGRVLKGSDFLILFQNLRHANATKKGANVLAGRKTAEEVKEVDRLRRELASTHDHLRDLVEDQQAAQEELRAANEEILSSNEELQSTNEELETAKEELQSSNEELTTLNEELQNRNTELTQTAADLYALLNGVEMPVAILGKDLRIRRYSSTAEKLFNLLPSDVGRPIGQIRSNLDTPDLASLANQVVNTLRPLQKEVRDQKGHWYSMRIRPYRTNEDQVDGVLIALVDINDLKQFSTAIVDTIGEALLVLDSKFIVLSANQGFYRHFKVNAAETENRSVFELGDGQWNIPALQELLQKVLPNKQSIVDFEVKHDFPGIGPKTMLLNASVLHEQQTGAQRILLAINDITNRG